MRELLFYGFIGDFLVRNFILDLTAISNSGDGVFMKINSSGGDVFSGWGMIAEWRAFKNPKKVLVHGSASSMMSVFVLYADDVSAIEQTQFVLHRASAFFEEDPTSRKILNNINRDMRKAFEDKLDIKVFEEIGGVNIERFFDNDLPPVDVVLTAQQAKSIGLIKKVVSLSTKEADDINRNMIAACSKGGFQMLKETEEKKKPTAKKEETETKSRKKMDLVQLKKDHPELVESIEATAAKFANAAAAVTSKVEELDRVRAWTAWKDVDMKKVMNGIEGGEAITTAQTQEFMAQSAKNAFSAKSEEGSPGSLEHNDDAGEGKEGEGDAKSQEISAFGDKVNANLGIKTSVN